ncbi:MAG: hypothetical protein AAF171_26010 [Cyanobacteria bacterium P01_A01_bin.116]
MSDNQSPQNPSEPQPTSGSPRESAVESQSQSQGERQIQGTLPGVAPFDTQSATIESAAMFEAAAFKATEIEGFEDDRLGAGSPPETDNLEEDVWETLNLPGTIDQISASEQADFAPVSTETTTKAPLNTAKAPAETERENELLKLIHDLNECNDVLLSRVAQLEGDLEKSQVVLKNEVEKATFAQEKMAKQVSAEQASVQQVSQTAQQQVAKLVSKLETNEQALSRQQLINENLQTELTNTQERITQLERECALISQQHADEAQARLKAETTGRDLRSRLQRQQRYTLQFKAALEKSLTVSARPTSSTSATSTSLPQTVAFNSPAAVTMPKAQHIMPWASNTTAFQGIDPHLETLIRNAGKPTGDITPPSSKSTAPKASAVPNNHEKIVLNDTPAVDPAAEAQLWQDLERVMNSSATEGAASEGAASEDAVKTAAKTASPNQAERAPNKIEIKETPAEVIESSDIRSLDQQNAVREPGLEKSAPDKAPSPAKKAKIPSFQVPKLNWQGAATRKSPAPTASEDATPTTATTKASSTDTQRLPESVFTEPSPWGKPLSTDSPSAVITGSQIPTHTEAIPDTTMAATNATTTAAPEIAPIAQPLKAKKKVSSMAAVELPTFETAKAGSFKR